MAYQTSWVRDAEFDADAFELVYMDIGSIWRSGLTNGIPMTFSYSHGRIRFIEGDGLFQIDRIARSSRWGTDDVCCFPTEEGSSFCCFVNSSHHCDYSERIIAAMCAAKQHLGASIIFSSKLSHLQIQGGIELYNRLFFRNMTYPWLMCNDPLMELMLAASSRRATPV